jgi:hypothetical protein
MLEIISELAQVITKTDEISTPSYPFAGTLSKQQAFQLRLKDLAHQCSVNYDQHSMGIEQRELASSPTHNMLEPVV